MTERLFTARFFTMCAFTFTVFLSAFQLFPTAPYRILALGGGNAAAGLFLGFLTWSSAASAPLTGSIADRIGRTRVLLISSLVIAGFSLLYAFVPSWQLFVTLPFVHGVFWSGLLSASAASITSLIPERRQAEGIGYWGMSTMLAIAAAAPLGLWLYARGWIWVCASSFVLNLAMAAIAFAMGRLDGPQPKRERPARRGKFLEGRVLAFSASLFFCWIGYGGLTSFVALYTESRGITPHGLFFTCFAIAIILTRPFSGRIADRVGYRNFLVPCLLAAAAGLALLAAAKTPLQLGLAGVLYGASFGNVYPAFAPLATRHVPPERRGAAFGSLLAAMDTGIGTGSILMGSLVASLGYAASLRAAAVACALSVPLMLVAERLLLRRVGGGAAPGGDDESRQNRCIAPESGGP